MQAVLKNVQALYRAAHNYSDDNDYDSIVGGDLRMIGVFQKESLQYCVVSGML
jgi:hypothetical protein